MSTGPGESSLDHASACEEGAGVSPFDGACARASTLQPTTSADSSQDATRFLMQKPAVSGGVWKAVSANFILISSRCPAFIGCLSRFSMSECNSGSPGGISFILVAEFLRTRYGSSLLKEYTNRAGEEGDTRCGGSNIDSAS